MPRLQFTSKTSHIFSTREDFCLGVAKKFAALPLNLSDSFCLGRTIKDIKLGFIDPGELSDFITRFTDVMNTAETHLHELRANKIGALQRV